MVYAVSLELVGLIRVSAAAQTNVGCQKETAASQSFLKLALLSHGLTLPGCFASVKCHLLAIRKVNCPVTSPGKSLGLQ